MQRHHPNRARRHRCARNSAEAELGRRTSPPSRHAPHRGPLVTGRKAKHVRGHTQSGPFLRLSALPGTSETDESTFITFLQVYTLCSPDQTSYEILPDRTTGQRERVPDALVKARVYYYAFVHECIKTGLKGGRLVL